MTFLKLTGDSPEFESSLTTLYINPAQITVVTPLGLKGSSVRLSCGLTINVKDQTPINLLGKLVS